MSTSSNLSKNLDEQHPKQMERLDTALSNSLKAEMEDEENNKKLRSGRPRFYFGSRYHRNLENLPLDFDSSPFLKGIYLDQAEELVVQKCVQIGISEMLICDALSLADTGLRVFYVLPTIELRNVFVRDRVDRVLLSVPYYRGRSSREFQRKEDLPEIDNVGLKGFGHGVILFVGSNSRISFLSFPADVVLIDERDECNSANLPMAEDRLQHSTYKWKRTVGVPTVEGFGVNEEYVLSDQKTFQIKCEACGEWQELDFFRNVVREVGDNEYALLDTEWTDQLDRDVQCYCHKCGAVIDRLAQGEWIKRYEDRVRSGYRINQLMSDRVEVRGVWQSFVDAIGDMSKMQRFHNSVRGMPFTAKGVKLTRAILDECIKAGQGYSLPSRAEGTTMGLDVGSMLHVWIADHPVKDKRRTVFAGTVSSFDDAQALITRYGVQFGVVDYEPERRATREFQEKTKNCKIYLCDYVEKARQADVLIDHEDQFIKVDRTQVLDGFVADLTGQTMLLPVNAATLDDGDFYIQLCVPTRVEETNASGVRVHRWVDGGKPDHYFHAGSYERIASMLYTPVPDRIVVDQKHESFPHRVMVQGLNRRRR